MTEKNLNIIEAEILEAQKLWAEQIVQIGKLYLEKGNYRDYAYNFVKNLYAYDTTKVLFKPTLASKKQFRNTFDEALSYFIGGPIEEDEGFALKCWDNIRFGERHISILEEHAIAMGNYFFKRLKDKNEIKVEYTFGYIKNKKGSLMINLHHSSLPFEKNI